MENKKIDIKKLTTISILVALQIVLSATPIGFIPLGFTRATTIHIPVIIGAILMGPKVGALLGGVFGVLSLITNTIAPTATSFVFSPFYSIGGTSGNLWSLVICFVPRILIGVFAGYLYLFLQKKNLPKVFSCAAAGVVGSLTNTLLVMGGIFLFFGQSYAQARKVAFEQLFGVIAGIIGINGLPEAVVAGVLCAAITVPLLKINKTNS